MGTLFRVVSSEGNRKSTLLVCLTLIIALLMACCPYGYQLPPIVVENKTDQILTIYINDTLIGSVAPGSAIKNNKVIEAKKYLIEAKNTRGELFYSQQVTFQEMMQKKEFKITIRW